jgi:excinuclease ABC subunit B
MFSFYEQVDNVSETLAEYESADSLNDIIQAMEDEMNQAARELAFEKAAELRDQIKALKKIMLY